MWMHYLFNMGVFGRYYGAPSEAIFQLLLQRGFLVIDSHMKPSWNSLSHARDRWLPTVAMGGFTRVRGRAEQRRGLTRWVTDGLAEALARRGRTRSALSSHEADVLPGLRASAGMNLDGGELVGDRASTGPCHRVRAIAARPHGEGSCRRGTLSTRRGERHRAVRQERGEERLTTWGKKKEMKMEKKVKGKKRTTLWQFYFYLPREVVLQNGSLEQKASSPGSLEQKASSPGKMSCNKDETGLGMVKPHGFCMDKFLNP